MAEKLTQKELTQIVDPTISRVKAFKADEDQLCDSLQASTTTNIGEGVPRRGKLKIQTRYDSQYSLHLNKKV